MHKPATWHDYVASRLLDEHIQPGIHAHLEVAVRIPGVVQPLDLAYHLAEEQAQTYTRLDVIGVCVARASTQILGTDFLPQTS